MTNHKHWSISSAPVRQLLEMGDTPGGTTEYIGRVGQIYKELYEIRTNYFNSEICFRVTEYILALSKHLSIKLYPVKTLDQVEIGRYPLTYQDGITITQKQYPVTRYCSFVKGEP